MKSQRWQTLQHRQAKPSATVKEQEQEEAPLGLEVTWAAQGWASSSRVAYHPEMFWKREDGSGWSSVAALACEQRRMWAS